MEVGQLWVKLGLDKTNYDNGINDSKNQSSGLAGFIKNAFQFTVGAGMFDVIKNGIKSAWDTSIGYNSQIQQSTAAFTTLLGNAGKASSMLGALSKMAADTPFELTDLTKASQTLLGFGIDSKNVMSDLQMLGDISMGNKERFSGLSLAFAQIQSAGKLTGQDLLQLISNGFNPLQTMSKQTGLSMAELKDKMSKGAISADMVSSAFKAATEKGGIFYGSMDKQSKTFEGQMSTLSDNVKSTLGGVMKPQFEYISNVILPMVIDKVSKFGDAFKSGGLKEALKTFIPPQLVDGLSTVGDDIKNVFGWIEKHGEGIKTIIAGITTAFVAYKVAVMASIVQQEISNTLAAISAIRAGKSAVMLELETGMKGSNTIAQWLLNAAMSANPLAIVILAVVALVGAFIYLWRTNEGFRKAVIEMWTVLSNGVVGAVKGIKNGIVNGFNAAIEFITALPAKALQWGKDFIQGLIDGITGSIGKIGSAVSGVADKIKSFLHFSRPDEGPLRDYESWMPDFINGMAKGIDSNKSTLFDKIKNLASNMALNINGSFSGSNGNNGGINKNQTININGPVNMNSQGDINSSLQQLQFLTQI
jgi:tape measure domain-containing protein